MPNWKKVITSGSDASLNSLDVALDITGSNALITNDLDVLGNVGIGTTSPFYPLHISKNTVGNGFSINIFSTATKPDAQGGSVYGGFFSSTGNSTATVDNIVGSRNYGEHTGTGQATFIAGSSHFAVHNGSGNSTGIYAISPKAEIKGTGVGSHQYVIGANINNVLNNSNATVQYLEGAHIAVNLQNGTVTDNAIGLVLDFDYTAGVVSGDLDYLRIQNDTLPTVGGTARAINSLSTLPSVFAGDIGIGTTSPGAKLDVDGDVKFSSYGSGTNTGTATQRLGVTSAGNVIEIPIGSGAVDGSGTTNFVTKWIDGDTVGDSVIFDNGTNVGIGTTSPDTKLEVADTTPTLRLTDTRNLNVGDWDDVSLGKLQFKTSDTSSPGARVLSEIEAYSGPAAASAPESQLRFKTATNSDTSATTKMTISATGNVGIGTTTPNHKLSVAGGTIEVNNGGATWFGSDATGGFARTFNGNSFRFISSANSETMRINNATGNVGIGTTSPSKKLTVNGQTQFYEYSGAHLTNAAHSNFNFDTLANNSSSLSGGSLGAFIKVTASPTGATGTWSAIRSRAYGENTQGNTDNLINFFAEFRNYTSTNAVTLNHHAGLKVQSLGVGGLATVTNNYGVYLDVGTAATNNYGVYQVGTSVKNFFQGNVGIGTTSPSQKLHVEGNARVTGAYYDSGNTPGTVNQLLASTATGTSWIDPSTITAEAASLVVIACKNTSGATITKGTPVYQTGNVGATATIEIAPADALISANKLPAIGVLQTDLNNNGLGNVVITGELTNFTTDPIDGVTPTVGDKIFVKSGGGLTLTKPTGEGNGIQNMGLVGKVSGGNAGSITVSSIMRTNDVPNLPEGRIWVGDGNTIVSDTVYIDEPNLRLGIGTDSPAGTLHVSKGSTNTYPTPSTNADVFIIENKNAGNSVGGGMTIFADNGGTGNIYFGDEQSNQVAGITCDNMNGNTELFFTTNGNNERLRIDGSGNVGIGTTSPGQKLHVVGEGKIQGNLMIGSSGDVSGAAGQLHIKGPNAQVIVLEDTDNANLVVRLSAEETVGFKIEDTTNSNVLFFGDEDGNVGIGTTSPSEKLDIIGNIKVRGTNNLTIGSTSTGGNFNLSSGIRGFNFANSNGDLVRIDQNGNVGIGTTSPGAKLHLADSASGGNPSFILQDDARSGAAALNYVLLTDSLNTNQAKIGYLSGLNTDLTLQNLVGSTSLVSSAQTKVIAGTNTLFENSGSEKMRITSAGSVGIGTTSPSTKLHVFEAGTSMITVDSGATAPYKAGIEFLRSSINGGSIYNDGNNVQIKFDSYFGYDSANPSRGGFQFRTAPVSNNTMVDAVRIDALGSVGIGTTTPSEKLQVNNGKLYITESANASTANLVYLENSGSGGNEGVSIKFNPMFDAESMIASNREGAASDNANLTFHTALADVTTERMRITSSGNVGIGTTAPEKKLHVAGGDVLINNGQYYTAKNNTGANYKLAAITTGNQVAIGAIDYTSAGTIFAGGDNVSITTGGVAGSSRLKILSNGNVGIGTTNPATKLDVRGDITITNANGGNPTDAGSLYFTEAAGVWGSTQYGFRINQQGTSNYLNFQSANTTTVRDILTLARDTGNVGIGTTSPSFKLEVTGNAKVSSNFYIGNVDAVTTATEVLVRQSDRVRGITPANLINASGGPYLPLAGGTMTGTNGVLFPDNFKLNLGSNSDLQIYHDGSNSRIKDVGTGDLLIDAANLSLRSADGSGLRLKSFDSGTVKLYHGTGANEKLATTATGITVTGTVTATTFSGDLNGTINTATTAVTKPNATDDTTVATTAFVQNLIETIPAGLVFQGTWNADTNTPTLTNGTGTTGHFYIVSTEGSTNLDGITDWKVGDWAVFVEQGATDAWEKVDNSSVLDGSGTGNQIPKWAGSGTSNTLTDSIITDNGTNVEVDGTFTATGNSTIQGRTNLQKDLIIRGTDTLANQGAARLYVDNSNRLFIDTANDGLGLVTIDSTGNVGIGTTSPGAKLEVSSDHPQNTIRLENTDTSIDTAQEPNAIEFYTNDASTSGTGVTGKISQVAQNAGNLYGIAFSTYNLSLSESMRIDSLGNVGIGTTTPSQKLDVAGNISVYNSYAAGASLFLNHSNQYSSSIIKSIADTIDGQDSGSSMLRFYTNDNSTTSPTVALDLTSESNAIFYGKVGIGTTTPSEILQVGNDSVGSNYIQIAKKDNTDAGIKISETGSSRIGFLRVNPSENLEIGTESTNDVDIFTNGVSRVTIDGDNGATQGYVGIGTASPIAKLTINSTSGDNAGGLSLYDGSGTAFYMYQVADNKFVLEAGNGLKNLVLDNAGNVGIGTTSPSAKLDIVGDLQVLGVNISNQENLDVDTGTETIATVAIADYDAAFFDYVIKNGTDLRAGTVFAVHNGTSVEFTETSTSDLGNTSRVTLSVDISGADMRLRATATSDDWIVKSLVRAI